MTMNTINHRHPQIRRLKLAALLNYDHLHPIAGDQYNNNNNNENEIIINSPTSDSSSSSSSTPRNSNSSSNSDSPTNINHHPSSPYAKSPWIVPSPALIPNDDDNSDHSSLIGSIVRQQQGHVYSLAVSGDLLYTGSDSKNIRVWRNLEEFAGFKSKSGLVKSIVIHGDRIFTGHQDGKIRVWNGSGSYKRIGSLPTLKNSIKSSFNPKNYVEVRRKKSVLKIKHYDAVSSMALDSDLEILYSGSWDKTLKVWRIGDNNNNECLESINAHDDAINAVATGFGSLVFTGSADGTVKVWRREVEERLIQHSFVETILEQEEAVTALAVSAVAADGGDGVLYCGSSDGMVNFWEGRGEQLTYGGALRGHKKAVLCVVTAGNLVMSGSADNTICVWRREAGGVHVCLSVLTGHSGPVKCLAVDEENGNELDSERRRFVVYSGSLDSSVKIWRVEDHAPEWRECNQIQNQSTRVISSGRS